MFTSKTCTVESLSKETVSMTSFTALWNSVMLPRTLAEDRGHVQNCYNMVKLVHYSKHPSTQEVMLGFTNL